MSKRPLCLAALLLIFGIVIMNMAGRYEPISLPESILDQTIQIRGQVYRQEMKKKNNLIYLKKTSIISRTESSYHSNIIVYTTENTTYEIGDAVSAIGICTQPEKPGNPGQFDMQRYYQMQNIGMILQKSRVTLAAAGRQNWYRRGITQVRERLKTSFDRIAEPEEAGLLSAMVLGERSGLEEEIKELYQLSGISHILAISGLHISMLGIVLFGRLRKVGLSFLVASGITGAIMFSYCFMTGFGVSTMRAFLMFLVYLGAQVLGRTYDLQSALSLAVIVILTDNPRWLFQGSFQLSALAVGGLAVIYPILKRQSAYKNKVLDSFLISAAVQLAILPCILFHFYEFPATGIFLNLLILPFSTILLLCGLLSGIVGTVTLAGGVLLFAPCHYILLLYRWLCEWSLQIPGALQIWGRPAGWNICFYYIIVAGVLFLLQKDSKTIRKWGICAAALSLGIGSLKFPKAAGLELTFLDVGQGDSIFWRTETGRTFLCDGGSTTVSQVGKYRIEPFLKYHGVAHLDYLFLTHMDEDHVNGVEELLEKPRGGISIGHLILPELINPDERYRNIEELAAKKQIPIYYFHQGMVIKDQTMELSCLYPESGNEETDKNAASLVLNLSYGKFQTLLTGDLEGSGEKAVQSSNMLSAVSVLKVAHHGSGNSTSIDFLEKTKPQFAIISCGKNNSYGHPHKELLERLSVFQTGIYSTMSQGAIRVSANEAAYSVETYLKTTYLK